MFLALREVRRTRGRFVLLAGAVSLLVILLLFFQSVAGALTTALTGALDNQSADIIVYGDDARRSPAASVLSPDVVDAVASVEGVAAAQGVRQTFATVRLDGEQVEATLLGLDLGGPGTPTSVSEGRLPQRAGEAVYSGGFEPAEDVGTAVPVLPQGPTVEITAVADDAAVNASPTLFVPTATWNEAVRARTGASEGELPISWVAVEPADGASVDAVVERITTEVDGVDAVDRATAVASLPGVDTITQSFGILYALLYIVVSIVTGVFFLILTVQKRDALVLLRAVGARRRDVVGPVLLQVVLVVGAGVLFGGAATAGLLALARDTFGAGLAPATAATSGVAILLLGLVAALGAVRRVLAIDPVEATTTGGLE